MELDATDIKFAMAEGHNLSFVADGSDFEAVWEILLRNHPRVIAPNGDITLNTAEDGVVGNDMTGRGDTMKDVAEVLEFASEGLSDCLMT